MDRAGLKRLVRDVPDFPKPGILFKDITPLLRTPGALDEAIHLMAAPYIGQRVDVVTGAESRGFIFASAVARQLSAGFVPIRKPGKLPAQVASGEYELEYGKDSLEVHVDAIHRGDHVLLVDDLLATGGTMKACINLVRGLGGRIVGAAFLIELGDLGGRSKLDGVPVHSVLNF